MHRKLRPLWPRTDGQSPVQIHCGILDPAATAQPDWDHAFATASRKATALMDLPVQSMSQPDLKTALDKIAAL